MAYILTGAKMARPTKNEQIPNLADAIKNSAWEQIAEKGAAALSLRAIARDIGITAPAIYNHFYRRDDLVTALIVDAYRSLGKSQQAAISNSPEADIKNRFITLGRAYREWAITYPQRYQLIFGTPIPNYQAPEELTLPAANQALVPLLETIQAFSDANRLRSDQLSPLNAELKAMLTAWQVVAEGFAVEVLYAALVTWSRVHGLVSMEIGNHFPSYITDPGEVFRQEIHIILNQYLLEEV
jgi:AcrR family transcriptional regulator